MVAHPYLRGPSSKLKQIGILLGQMPFFCAPSSLTKASFRRFAVSQKIAQPKVARFASFSDSVGNGKYKCGEGWVSVDGYYK